MYVRGSTFTYSILEVKVGKKDQLVFYSIPYRKFSIPMLANHIHQKKFVGAANLVSK